MQLSTAVKRVAKEAGGIRALARVTGLSAPYVCRLANGEKCDPSDDVLGRLGLVRTVDYKITSNPAKQFDSDAEISIPRSLIGAACHAIDKKHDAPNLLAKLRQYTFNARGANGTD